MENFISSVDTDYNLFVWFGGNFRYVRQLIPIGSLSRIDCCINVGNFSWFT
jgi:hypothetical protein